MVSAPGSHKTEIKTGEPNLGMDTMTKTLQEKWSCIGRCSSPQCGLVQDLRVTFLSMPTDSFNIENRGFHTEYYLKLCLLWCYACCFHFQDFYTWDVIWIRIESLLSIIINSSLLILYIHTLFLNYYIDYFFSCPSRITSNCLTHLCPDISGWPSSNIYSHLHFHKPPSHLHHLDKRWDWTLWWQHPFFVSVSDQQKVSHLREHLDSDGGSPRTIRVPCHHWRMGESAKLHTKCQKEYNSERSVLYIPSEFLKKVQCTLWMLRR